MILVSLIVSVFMLDPPASTPNAPIDPAAFDRLVIDSLRDIHNLGASLYNEGKDFNGCYRMYEGSLRTVRPLLAHRPKIQKLIDEEMAKLGADETVRSKAFRLHELIETVRGELRGGAVAGTPKKIEPAPEKKNETAPAPAPSKPKETVPEKTTVKSPSPVPLTNVPTPPVANANTTWTGTITLDGRPLKGAEVTLISLDIAEPKIVTGTSNDKGNVEVRLPSPGRYSVVVTGPGVPEKYKTTTTSGIRIDFKAGSDISMINLSAK